jgi:hypothetical protein
MKGHLWKTERLDLLFHISCYISTLDYLIKFEYFNMWSDIRYRLAHYHLFIQCLCDFIWRFVLSFNNLKLIFAVIFICNFKRSSFLLSLYFNCCFKHLLLNYSNLFFIILCGHSMISFDDYLSGSSSMAFCFMSCYGKIQEE